MHNSETPFFAALIGLDREENDYIKRIKYASA
jgi:hypothetical protein